MSNLPNTGVSSSVSTNLSTNLLTFPLTIGCGAFRWSLLLGQHHVWLPHLRHPLHTHVLRGCWDSGLSAAPLLGADMLLLWAVFQQDGPVWDSHPGVL